MSNVPMTLPELAISIQARPFGHNSSYVELDDGRIIHCSHRVREWYEDAGLTWSQTWHDDEFMVDVDGNPVGDAETSLVKLSGRNEIGLAARVSDEPAETEYAMPARCFHFRFWRSTDGGETGQRSVRMSPPGLPTAGLQDTFLRTSSLLDLPRADPHAAQRSPALRVAPGKRPGDPRRLQPHPQFHRDQPQRGARLGVFQNLYSMHETIRIEPGPIEPTRPEEIYFPAGQPTPERDPRFVVSSGQHIRGSYLSCFVMKDRVLVTHTMRGDYEPHPTLAQLEATGTGKKHPETGRPMCQALKILPLKWF